MACKSVRTFPQEGGAEYTGLKYAQFDKKEHEFCWGLCCVQGCIMGTIALIIIFVIFPTGIMMVFHGSKKRNNVTFSAGICILASPFVILCPSILVHRWRHRVLKEKNSQKRIKKEKYEFRNEEEFDNLAEDIL